MALLLVFVLLLLSPRGSTALTCLANKFQPEPDLSSANSPYRVPCTQPGHMCGRYEFFGVSAIGCFSPQTCKDIASFGKDACCCSDTDLCNGFEKCSPPELYSLPTPPSHNKRCRIAVGGPANFATSRACAFGARGTWNYVATGQTAVTELTTCVKVKDYPPPQYARYGLKPDSLWCPAQGGLDAASTFHVADAQRSRRWGVCQCEEPEEEENLDAKQEDPEVHVKRIRELSAKGRMSMNHVTGRLSKKIQFGASHVQGNDEHHPAAAVLLPTSTAEKPVIPAMAVPIVAMNEKKIQAIPSLPPPPPAAANMHHGISLATLLLVLGMLGAIAISATLYLLCAKLFERNTGDKLLLGAQPHHHLLDGKRAGNPPSWPPIPTFAVSSPTTIGRTRRRSRQASGMSNDNEILLLPKPPGKSSPPSATLLSTASSSMV